MRSPAKQYQQPSDIPNVRGVSIGVSRSIAVSRERNNMRFSVDTLVFTLVVVAAFIGLWADTVRTWLVW
ncbi:MAG: hypothetical protein ACM3SS_16325 [Rhodospirillaceae bacterium]